MQAMLSSRSKIRNETTVRIGSSQNDGNIAANPRVNMRGRALHLDPYLAERRLMTARFREVSPVNDEPEIIIPRVQKLATPVPNLDISL